MNLISDFVSLEQLSFLKKRDFHKNLLMYAKYFVLLFVLFLCSCTNSKYKYEIKYADTEEIADSGYLKIAESIFYKGEDAVAYIQIVPVEVKDTTYNFYICKASSSIVKYRNNVLFYRPVYSSKFKYLSK